MTAIYAIWLSGALALMGAVTLAYAIIINRRSSKPAPEQAIELAPAFPLCAGPVARLDFTQSLDPVLFAQAAEEEVLAYTRVHLTEFLPDGVSIGLQGIRHWAARSEMVVAASAEATKAVKAGRAMVQVHKDTGRRMGHIVNAQNKQTVEVMKEVGYGRKALAGAAAAGAMAVSLAHIISAADLARTLKLVDQKLDLLLAYRQIDQTAEMERIYASARELLTLPIDETTRMELWRLRGELRELRIIWRQELKHHIMQIENPSEDSWIEWVFTPKSRYDKIIVTKISDGQARLIMIEYSLRLDRVLAAASETWEASSATLADDLAAIERVGALLKEKASFISEKRRGAAQPMIDGISEIVDQYRSFLQTVPDSTAGNLAYAQAATLLPTA